MELAKVLKSKPIDGDDLELKAKNVDSILRESGGLYYHKKSWVENVEMLLVAAIVVIGIRSFFVQHSLFLRAQCFLPLWNATRFRG